MIDFLKRAKDYQDDLIADLQEMIAIESIEDYTTSSPQAPFGENLDKILQLMLKKGEVEGFKATNVDHYAGILELGSGEEIVSMLGHLDIVPIGDGWTKDPLGGEVEDGYIFGRGSDDDKGATIAAYYAMKILRDINPDFKRRIWLILGTNEETGMKCMDYFKENHPEQPTFGFVPDADFPAIYGECGIFDTRLTLKNNTVIKELKAGTRPNIVIAQAQVVVDGPEKPELFKFYLESNRLEGSSEQTSDGAKYTIYGKAFHGAWPHKGVNAAYHAINFVANAYHDEELQKISKLLHSPFGHGLGVEIDGYYMGPLTMNLGIVSIDEKISLTLDMRYPNDTNSETLLEKMKTRLDEVGLDFEIKVLTDSAPLFVDPNSELVKTCVETYREFSKDTFTPPQTTRGGTYARKLANHFAFGPSLPTRPKPSYVGGPHEKDEGMEIESLVLATAIYAKALYRLTVSNDEVA